MFCKYCGNELPENVNFCPQCGKINEDANKEECTETSPVAFEEPLNNEPEYEEVDPLREEKDALGGNILKLAIFGLAFGLTVWFSLLGLIFSVIARTKVREYVAKFGETERRATVGKSISTAGLAVSIAFTVIMTTMLLIVISSLIYAVL